jgi:hypothetical protein
VAIKRNGTGANTFKDDAVVTVSVLSVSGTGLSASMDSTTITLPSNWTTVANNTLSGAVSSKVTLATGGTAGSFSGSVTYRAKGSNMNTPPVTITRDDTMTVTATISDAGACAPAPSDTAPPSVTVAFPAPTAGLNGWFNAGDVLPVVGTVTASDSSNVTLISCTGATLDSVTGYGTNTAGGSLTVSGDGIHNVSCSATDGASPTNMGAAPDSVNTATIKIDANAPSIADDGPTAGPDGDNDWYTSAVTENFSASDATSSLDDCPASFTRTSTTEGSAVKVSSGPCSDKAGNTNAGIDSPDYEIDTTGPSATLAVTRGTLGNNDWYTSDVTLSTSGGDSVSGPVTCTADQSQTADTAGRDFNGSCTNDAGLTTNADPLTVKLDKVAPTITGVPDFGPNLDGWNNSAVTISYTCSDAMSGLSGPCPDPDGFSTEGTYSWSRTAYDNAGNSATALGVVNIDLTKPTIVGSASPGANPAGWNSTDVTVSFTCADTGGSGLKGCTGARTLGEGANQSVTGTATDHADNSASVTVSDINVDRTPPTIIFEGTTPASPNGNGWFDSDVTLTWSCTDGLSGAEAATVTQTLSEGADQTATGTCTDLAGNTASETQTGINIDETDPIATFVSRTPSNGNGWNNADVTVNWSCSDSGSGVVMAGISQPVSTEGENQSATGTCEDLAGNSASDTRHGISIDKSDPTASASASPEPNANGWNKTNVTVSFDGSDSLSGKDFCDADIVLSSEGAGQSASGTCTDKAGNVSDPATASGINIDKTAPNVSLVGGPQDGQSYYFGFVPAVPTCSANDLLSGLDGSCSVVGYGTTVGAQTVKAVADDKAGNQGSAGASYTVLAWTLNGFYRPVDMNGVFNLVKGGSTVPLKFEIFAGTTELTVTSYVTSLKYAPVACDATAPLDTIEALATGGTVLRYDATAGQYVYNWQTPKTIGCFSVVVRMQDGGSIAAFFKLK